MKLLRKRYREEFNHNFDTSGSKTIGDKMIIDIKGDGFHFYKELSGREFSQTFARIMAERYGKK